MDEDKFIFCDTPASLIVRLDHVLHCPVWFEELKQDANNNLYSLIDLAEEHRTVQLKMFHATQAIMSENWKQLSIHLIAAHLAATDLRSRLVIIDGYPLPLLDTAATRIAEQVVRVLPIYKKQSIDVFWAKEYTDYINQLFTVQGQDKKAGRVSFNLSEKKLAAFVPTIDAYNEALGKYHVAQQNAQAQQASENPRFRPYIVKPGDEDGGQGGMLQ